MDFNANVRLRANITWVLSKWRTRRGSINSEADEQESGEDKILLFRVIKAAVEVLLL